MRTLHQTLRLQHRSHTGHRLHHKHTSYRALAVVLVAAGIFIAGLSMMAHATADGLVQVTARIPAPIPNDPPVITSPVDGTAANQAAAAVSGTCPVITPSVIIAILDNGNFVGSAPCDSDQTFSVDITLAPGGNQLVARVYTITGDTGRDSAPVHVTYTPKGPEQTGGESSSQSGSDKPSTGDSTGTSLDLTIDAPFVVFGPSLPADWEGSITGGVPPYRVHIDWGDGSNTDVTVAQSGRQSFRHRYRDMHAYIITFTVTDAAGNTVTRQYAAVTPYLSSAIFNRTTLVTGPGPLGGNTIIGLYGVYLFLLAAAGGLWVHARHEFAYARVPAGQYKRHKPAARKHA